MINTKNLISLTLYQVRRWGLASPENMENDKLYYHGDRCEYYDVGHPQPDREWASNDEPSSTQKEVSETLRCGLESQDITTTSKPPKDNPRQINQLYSYKSGDRNGYRLSIE